MKFSILEIYPTAVLIIENKPKTTDKSSEEKEKSTAKYKLCF